MAPAAVWTTKMEWTSDFSFDSVEWCPVTPYRNVLVCGAYQLAEQQATAKKQQRLGRIFLFVINNDDTELTPIQTIHTTGILDQKWCYQTLQDYPTLAVVTAVGTLQLYRLIDDHGIFELKLWTKHEIDPDALALSVDWSTNKNSLPEPRIVISDSLGFIHILELVGDKLQAIGKWKGHGFEAWISAFNYWNQDIFYSGGDDCLFRSYDVRVPINGTMVSKSHEAGVTVIRSHVDVEYQLLTGSYDEKVRLWDTRNLKSCVMEVNMNGGLWRLKWHPYKPNAVLAACMHGGFAVLNVNNKIEITSQYLKHDNLAYGADWKFDEEKSMVATCSFYNCMLHLSEIAWGVNAKKDVEGPDEVLAKCP